MPPKHYISTTAGLSGLSGARRAPNLGVVVARPDWVMEY
jgi:hypothetical protein